MPPQHTGPAEFAADSPSPRPSPRGGEGEELRGEGEGRERFVVIHSLEHARAALAAAEAAGTSVTLASAEAAGGYAGPGWFKAIVDIAAAEFPGVVTTCVLDCGEEAGTVLAALRLGLRRVRFTGPAAAAARLNEIAAEIGAVIERDALEPALDLCDETDPAAACRAFLAGAGFAARPRI